MFRTSIAIVTSVLAALLVVGVAWAGSGESPDRSSVRVDSSARADDSASNRAEVEVTSSSVSGNGSTSTSVDDDGDRTSTSEADGSTSTSIDDDDDDDRHTTTTLDHDGSTSTSVDDNDVDDNDDEEDSIALSDQILEFDVSGAATVTVQVVAGRLLLVDVSLSTDWHQEIQKIESDEIELRFEKGDSRAELEVEIEDGRVEWEIKAS